MGVFQSRPEDEDPAWAGLPSEPFDPDAVDTLAAPAADPFGLGLGTSVSSVVLPAAPTSDE